jgi:hypothetical protein
MAETTSIWTWVSLGVGTVALFASVIVPGSIYFYDKSAAGVMTEDKIQKMNGAAVVKKEIEMTNNILNPAAILGGFKSAATEVANKKISDTTGAALNSVKEIGGGSSTEGGLKMPSIQAPDMPSIQAPDMSSIQANALNTMGSNQDLLKNSLTDATSATSGIPGLTQEVVQRRMQKMNEANINYNKGLQNASTSATNALKPFDKSKIKNFVPDQTNYTPGDVLNTVSRNRATTGGGRKTKNNRKKTVQPKVKKPRTKKCLITKGDKMFMSFCI